MIKRVIIILIILFALGFSTLVAVPYITTSSMLNVRGDYAEIDAADYGLTAEEVTLMTDDGLTLAAYLVEAESPKGVVVLVSGMHNPPVRTFYGYAKMFQDNGFSTLLVEMRSHGDSEGVGISMGMNEWLDVKAGAEYIDALEEYENLPIIAYGTSMGAGTVIIAGANVPEIDAVICASAFTKWSDLVANSMASMGVPKFYVAIQKPFFDLNLGLRYGLDKMQYTPINEIKKLDKPILLMQSEDDTQVPYACFEALCEAMQENDNGEISNLYIYTLAGDYHMICKDEYFENPIEDAGFSGAILSFLSIFGK